MTNLPEFERSNVQLNNIIEWPHNPRKERDDFAIDNTAANMRSQGQLMPLLLVPAENAGLYYAVDGETRRRGHLRNVDLGHTAFDMEIDCKILPADMPLAQLRAIALAANTVREEMTIMDKMRAFRDLASSGMKPRAIGEIFNISSRVVEQHMALGNLIESAQELVSAGQRQLGWAQAMTLGTPKQQEQIIAEIKTNAALYPDGASVRHHLTRGNIAVSSARFDTAGMKDDILRDLFTPDGEGYFNDSTVFWAKQMAAVATIVEEHQKTHKNVKLYDRERFNDAGWTTNGDLSIATAIVIVNHDGTVEERTGMIPPAYLAEEEGQSDDGSFLEAGEDTYTNEFNTVGGNAGSGDADSASTPTTAYSPLDSATKATNEYLGAQVVAELRLRVASDPRLAMAFIIAQTLTRNGGLASPMQIVGFDLEKSAQKSDVFIALDNRRGARDRIAHEAGIVGLNSPAQVVAQLMAMEDEPFYELFSWTVAESVAAPLNETTFEVYDAIGAEVMSSWNIEDAYLDTLTNAQIRALAAEIIDVANLPSKGASIKVVRNAIMASIETDNLQANWVGNQPSWLPPQIAKLRASVFNASDDMAAPVVNDDPHLAASNEDHDVDLPQAA